MQNSKFLHRPLCENIEIERAGVSLGNNLNKKLLIYQLIIIYQVLDHELHKQTCGKADWNDMNDSSQMSDASSDDLPPPKVDEKNATLPPTTLQKAQSSPQPVPKQRFDANQRIAENLQKLAKHTDSKVWLFVPNTFNNQEAEAEKILKDSPDFQKVVIAGRGFNLLLNTQLAPNYIQKGYNEKGISFKMIFSTKNENGQERRPQKKYSEKDKQGKNYEVQEIKSPRIKSKQTYTQRNNYPKDREEDRGDRKKVKYVAKQPSQKKVEEAPKIIVEVNETSEPSNTEKTISSKSESKTEQELNKKEQKSNEVKKPEQIKSEEQIKQKVQKNGEGQSDEENQKQEQAKQAKGKKKKNNNKKKKGKNGGGNTSNNNTFDPNNPFSSLVS